MNYLQWFCVLGSCLLLCGCLKKDEPARPTLLQCNGMRDLVVVAHPGDDLLFMNPDIRTTIADGGCVQVVYLAMSDDGVDADDSGAHEKGVQDAYAYMANVENLWRYMTVNYGAREQYLFELRKNNKISLMSFRIKGQAQVQDGLTPLSLIESVLGTSAPAFGAKGQTYDRVDVVMALSAIIRDYRPTTVRHLDDTVVAAYKELIKDEINGDHPDHVASARLVREALNKIEGNYRRVGYIANSTRARAPNLAQLEMSDKAEIFRRFAKYDHRYCQSNNQCNPFAGPEGTWVRRQYYTASHDTPPSLAPNMTGGYAMFTVGEISRAANISLEGDAQWVALGGRCVDPVVAFNFMDGRLGVLARDGIGNIWKSAQKPDGSWSQWMAFDGSWISGPPVIANHKDGRRAIIALGSDGVFKYIAEITPNGDWASSWISLPLLPNADSEAIVMLGKNGHLVVFATDRSGGLWVSSQNPVTPEIWLAWEKIDIPVSGGLAALDNDEGVIELYVRHKETGRMMLLTQTDPHSLKQWNLLADFDISYTGKPAIGRNGQGGIVVVALDQAGKGLWLVEDGKAGLLEGALSSVPALLSTNDALYVAARGDTSDQTYWVWVRKDEKWQSSKLSPPTVSGGSAFAF